jgi:dUTPase
MSDATRNIITISEPNQFCDIPFVLSDTVTNTMPTKQLEISKDYGIDFLKPYLPPIRTYGITIDIVKGDDGEPLRRGAVIPAAGADGLRLILPSFPEGGALPSTVFVLQPHSKLRVPLGVTVTLERCMQAEIVPDAPSLQNECVTVEVQLLSPGTSTGELHLTFINYGAVPVQIRAGESYARLILHHRIYIQPMRSSTKHGDDLHT